MKKTRKMLEVEARIGGPIEGYLRREYNSGKSTIEIGEQVGLTSGGVINWMKTFNIPRRDNFCFEKMIVFLRHGKEAPRTSNHVERNNRSFRMLQKTRYKRRKKKTIHMAIELDLYARMLCHPLFQHCEAIPLASCQSRREVAA